MVLNVTERITSFLNTSASALLPKLKEASLVVYGMVLFMMSYCFTRKSPMLLLQALATILRLPRT
jgi:hypothetical protein